MKLGFVDILNLSHIGIHNRSFTRTSSKVRFWRLIYSIRRSRGCAPPLRHPHEDIHGNDWSVEWSLCPRRSPEAPSDGICLDCWDAKIFPKNRRNKFLIRRQEALRGRRNHPGLEIRRRELDMFNASIRRSRGNAPKNVYEKIRMSTKPNLPIRRPQELP
jgi:hypothetical protein